MGVEVNPRIRKLRDAWNLTRREAALVAEAMDKPFRKQQKELFQTEGRSGGRKWKKLKKATVERKRKKGLDLRILHATRDLKRGLSTKAHPDHVAEAKTKPAGATRDMPT